MNPLFLIVMLFSAGLASAETTSLVEIVATNPSHENSNTVVTVMEKKSEDSVLPALLVSRRRYLLSMCQQFIFITWYMSHASLNLRKIQYHHFLTPHLPQPKFR
mmetsp:Transcript_3540/g.6840  ORF Transcript_3540/g.6840 Transcript_3540/m.6840 type:complete len:104 (-) Transcript_3540:2994-3305(-)